MKNEAIVGYARVSTEGQSLDQQQQRLESYGCTKIFAEKISGATSNRLQLKAALDYVRDGDMFVVTRLDRLARSVGDLANIVKLLQQKGVNLVVLDQQIDTSTPTGKLMFHMIGAFAEFERDLIRERCKEGINRAKSKGIKFGRKAVLSEAQIQKMRIEFNSNSVSKTQLATKYGISRASLYRLAKEPSEA